RSRTGTVFATNAVSDRTFCSGGGRSRRRRVTRCVRGEDHSPLPRRGFASRRIRSVRCYAFPFAARTSRGAGRSSHGYGQKSQYCYSPGNVRPLGFQGISFSRSRVVFLCSRLAHPLARSAHAKEFVLGFFSQRAVLSMPIRIHRRPGQARFGLPVSSPSSDGRESLQSHRV